MRFAHAISDAFLEQYAERVWDMGSIVFAYIENGEVHAAAELRKLSTSWQPDAEAAFSVEAAYQHSGIGTALMGRVICSARNCSVKHLYMSCLASNARMQAIARKFEARLHSEYGEVLGEICPAEANHLSYAHEEFEDRVGFMLAVLDLQNRIVQAA